jgi:hypothetical protein
MKKTIILTFVIAFVANMYSCTKDTALAPPPAPTCDSTHISYAKTIQPIMTNYCTSCHNPTYGSGANDLTQYTQVKAGMEDSTSLNSIICRTSGTTCGDIMPQYSRRGLAQVYRDTLNMWKNGGYCN